MKYITLFAFFVLLQFSCIQDDIIDDFVEPVIRITNPLVSIEVETTFDLNHVFRNDIGLEENIEVEWISSNDQILEVSSTGVLTGIEVGSAEITVIGTFKDIEYRDQVIINVSEGETEEEEEEIVTGEIVTTTFYVLEGSFELENTDNGVDLRIAENYEASSALPGLYIYFSNNPNSIANALEVARVEIFSGAHEYKIDDVKIGDYNYIVYFCKPFNVKVGEAQL